MYQAETHPPKSAGRCDHDGAELYQREDDRHETIRRASRSSYRRCSRSSITTPTRASCTPSTATQPHAEVTDSLLRAILQPAK
jgi:adenylate kinase